MGAKQEKNWAATCEMAARLGFGLSERRDGTGEQEVLNTSNLNPNFQACRTVSANGTSGFDGGRTRPRQANETVERPRQVDGPRCA